MSGTRGKYVPPAIDQSAFNCPHCEALAKQYWFSVHAEPLRRDDLPTRIMEDDVKKAKIDQITDVREREKVRTWFNKMATHRPFLDREQKTVDFRLYNLSVSHCFNCSDVALWIDDRLMWPRRGEAPLPNLDLPDELRADYDEASTILDLSPRGTAALLRLTIQKLCMHLGEKGKNLDDDIASLVGKGLDARVQKALDVVRVIGNNSVHPGQIDLRDDRATAEKLFGLVNLIADIMITQPKHIDEMFQ
ncbi:MAG TPA: DUF4145 domain-containing protein, partial [Reyranella sp.]|nr:DUF4145 domain-containing protein [Reyranella sp.]